MQTHPINLSVLDQLFDALSDRAQLQLLDHLIDRFPHADKEFNEALRMASFDVTDERGIDELEHEQRAEDVFLSLCYSKQVRDVHKRNRDNDIERALIHATSRARWLDSLRFLDPEVRNDGRRVGL